MWKAGPVLNEIALDEQTVIKSFLLQQQSQSLDEVVRTCSQLELMLVIKMSMLSVNMFRVSLSVVSFITNSTSLAYQKTFSIVNNQVFVFHLRYRFLYT